MLKARILYAALLLLSAEVAAQRRLVVVNAESKVPVRDVRVSVDNGAEHRTAWDGTVDVPDSFGCIHFAHPAFERRYVTAAELRGDSICLLPGLGRPGEVVIWGQRRFKKRMQSILTPSPQQEREQLPAVIPPGPDVLALLGWIYGKTLGPKVEARARRKKALKEVRRKEAELQQKWDLLRDTTAMPR